MKTVFLMISLLITLTLTGCYDSSIKDETSLRQPITNEVEAAQALSLLNSMNINLIGAGVTDSLNTQKSSSVNTQDAVTYPISYSTHRDCNISGTADTNGEQTSQTTYHAQNIFDQCVHYTGIQVDGRNTVDAVLEGDRLSASLTENEIEITLGSTTMGIYAPIDFYSDKAFTVVEIVLTGDAYLSNDTDSMKMSLNDFNITMNTQSSTLSLNGEVTFYLCDSQLFQVTTLTPLQSAANGLFTAGKLDINGVIFEFLSDNTVIVTLADGTQYTLSSDTTIGDIVCPTEG